MARLLKTQKGLDRRDLRLLRKVWFCAVEAVHAQSHGHTDKWAALEKALNKAEDEMGDPADYQEGESDDGL